MPSWWNKLTQSKRKDVLMALLLAVVCGTLFLAGHGRYGLFDVDEAIFTQATVEMRDHGQGSMAGLAMPTYNGEPRYHKPPLIYWLQDMAMNVLGEDSLYAARLPSALCALLTVLMLGMFIHHFTGNRKWALASAAALGINLSFLVVGRAATADGVLNLASLALALWVLIVLYGRKGTRSFTAQGQFDWVVTGLLAALGFLAKGPIAWLPALIIAATVLVVRRNRQLVIQQLQPIRSAAVVAVLLLPWVLLLVAAHGVAFFYEFFVVHNFSRYLGGMSNTQSNNYLYYLLVLMVGFFPWVVAAPKAMIAAMKKWRVDIAGLSLAKALPPLATVWAIVYVLFFTLSKTKLAHYIVPAYPALAIVVGWWLTQIPRPRLGQGMAVGGVILLVLLAGVALLANPLLLGLRGDELTGWLGWVQVVFNIQWPPHDEMAFAVLKESVNLGYALPLLGGLMIFLLLPALWLLMKDVRDALAAVWVSWAACLMIIVWGVVPVVWAYTQAPLSRLAARIGEYPAGTALVHLGLHKPSVLYLSHRHFIKLEKALQLPEFVRGSETLVLTEEPTVPAIQQELATQVRGVILAKTCEGGYCLLVIGQI